MLQMVRNWYDWKWNNQIVKLIVSVSYPRRGYIWVWMVQSIELEKALFEDKRVLYQLNRHVSGNYADGVGKLVKGILLSVWQFVRLDMSEMGIKLALGDVNESTSRNLPLSWTFNVPENACLAYCALIAYHDLVRGQVLECLLSLMCS